MARYNNAPVDQLKINLIKDMLSSPLVNYAYNNFVNLGNNGGTFKERENAFTEYCRCRDLYLGLTPQKKQEPQANLRQRVYQ